MTILSYETIQKKLNDKECGLRISPRYDERIQGASYDMGLGKIQLAGKEPIEVTSNSEITLPPGEWALLLSREEISLPLDVCATYGLRHSLTSQGLLWFGGPQVDPGYTGKLFLPVFNPTSAEISLTDSSGTDRGVFTIMFHQLDKPAPEYTGDFIGIRDIPSGLVTYMQRIGSSNYVKLARTMEEFQRKGLPLLNKEIEDLKLSVSELKQEMERIDQKYISILNRLSYGLIGGLVSLIVTACILIIRLLTQP